MCYEISVKPTCAFSAHLIENQFKICITIYEVSTCLLQLSSPMIFPCCSLNCKLNKTACVSSIITNRSTEDWTETWKKKTTSNKMWLNYINLKSQMCYQIFYAFVTCLTVRHCGCFCSCVCLCACVKVSSWRKSSDIVLLQSRCLLKPFSQRLTLTPSLCLSLTHANKQTFLICPSILHFKIDQLLVFLLSFSFFTMFLRHSQLFSLIQ